VFDEVYILFHFNSSPSIYRLNMQENLCVWIIYDITLILCNCWCVWMM